MADKVDKLPVSFDENAQIAASSWPELEQAMREAYDKHNWRMFGYEPAPSFTMPLRRRFVAYFWFVGWDCISLGVHFCLWSGPNIELHLPFGFIRIGWMDR